MEQECVDVRPLGLPTTLAAFIILSTFLVLIVTFQREIGSAVASLLQVELSVNQEIREENNK